MGTHSKAGCELISAHAPVSERAPPPLRLSLLLWDRKPSVCGALSKQHRAGDLAGLTAPETRPTIQPLPPSFFPFFCIYLFLNALPRCDAAARIMSALSKSAVKWLQRAGRHHRRRPQNDANTTRIPAGPSHFTPVRLGIEL